MARTGFNQRKPAKFKKRVRTGRLSVGARRPAAAPDKTLSPTEIQGPMGVDPLAGGQVWNRAT